MVQAGRNPPSYFFIQCFTVSVISSINTSESSNDFMVLIILFMSSFEINPFPALTAPSPLIFHSSLFIEFEAKLLTNAGKLYLAKWIATFLSDFA